MPITLPIMLARFVVRRRAKTDGHLLDSEVNDVRRWERPTPNTQRPAEGNLAMDTLSDNAGLRIKTKRTQ